VLGLNVAVIPCLRPIPAPNDPKSLRCLVVRLRCEGGRCAGCTALAVVSKPISFDEVKRMHAVACDGLEAASVGGLSCLDLAAPWA
jgi:hypothetical protein